MHIIILADGIGPKLWPVTSETLLKSFLPVFSEASLLEETLLRLAPLVDNDGDKCIIVTLDTAAESLIKQTTLDIFGIPETNLVSIPSHKGSARSIWEAVRFLIDVKKIPLEEPVLISPSDQFMWPKELAVFHLFNVASRLLTNPDEAIAVCLSPGGPSPGMNYFYGDWQQVATMNAPYEDPILGTVSTLGVPIEGYQVMPDLESAQDLVANNWMWDLDTYGGSLGLFDHYLTNALEISISQLPRWRTLEPVPFSFVVPSIIKDRKIHCALIPKIAWSTLDNWVSIKHLLYDSGLFQPAGQPEVHSIEAERNLIFKPPGKTVALYGISDLIVIDTGDKLLIGTPEGLHEYF